MIYRKLFMQWVGNFQDITSFPGGGAWKFPFQRNLTYSLSF